MLVPAEELQTRTAALQGRLRERGIDAALVVEAADLVYLTGTVQNAHLIVPATGEPLLLVRRDVDRARAESRLRSIEPLTSLRGLPDAVRRAAGHVRRLGLELDVLPAAAYLRYGRMWPDVELVDVSAALLDVRSRKSDWEVARIRAACGQVMAAHRTAREALRPELTDLDLQILLEERLRRLGHQGPMRFRGLNGEMFFGAVMTGPDAALPAYSETPLGGPGPSPAVGRGAKGSAHKVGMAMVVDLCGARDGYLSDATRTLFSERLDPPLDHALQVCELILTELEALLVPGVPASTLYTRGLELAQEAGFGDAWMGHGPGRVRFVGHGVGLEINEAPVLAVGNDAPLMAGNVVAVEPKLVFPGLGAVGRENTYLVRAAGGPETLTIDV
ncbi:MAG: Xaa-Pro aminopeptidase [uncultured Thermoleophilia bacterium]|uniref:Xaa-Pro aminopeptidase n=1 Tax=uncultured Thermoleophilia bacterium TaxID=1497501 RepID=A0A6J4TS31_9ACTN|nr:MAG: Xaa-Pro aminopeptidase [uncultured Thermoleophilia bacterium]